MHDLNDKNHYEEQILFEGKISIFNFVVVGRPRKNSKFRNFRKYSDLRYSDLLPIVFKKFPKLI